MLMRKKLFFGLVAAALVVLNALAFSFKSEAGLVEPPVTNGCYQVYTYECQMGVLRPACSGRNTGKRCKEFLCSSCIGHWNPGDEIIEY